MFSLLFIFISATKIMFNNKTPQKIILGVYVYNNNTITKYDSKPNYFVYQQWLALTMNFVIFVVKKRVKITINDKKLTYF